MSSANDQTVFSVFESEITLDSEVSLKKESIPCIVLRNNKTQEEAVVLPTAGGDVYQIRLRSKNMGNQLLTILEADEVYEEVFNPVAYHGSRLIPFPNRIRDGEYTFGGRKLQLPINEAGRHNALHGLLYSRSMRVTEKSAPSDTEASVTLEYDFDPETNEIDKKGYPFKVHVKTRYVLSQECGFYVETEAQATGDTDEAPFADGWHPYFSLATVPSVPPPSSASENDIEELPEAFMLPIDDSRLQLPLRAHTLVLKVDKQMIPTGDVIPWDKAPERDIAVTDAQGFVSLRGIDLDTGFYVPPDEQQQQQQQKMIQTKLVCIFPGRNNNNNNNKEEKEQQKEVTLVLWQDSSYPFIQIYTPNTRRSIAIEPMSACTDAFNRYRNDNNNNNDNQPAAFKSGLTILKKGVKDFKGVYGVYLE